LESEYKDAQERPEGESEPNEDVVPEKKKAFQPQLMKEYVNWMVTLI
jgi:hypothetical protein